MDFVDFESYATDVLPSPQPSLALPLKANIDHYSAKLPFPQLRTLLQPEQPKAQSNLLAHKYAALSLLLLEAAPADHGDVDASHARSSALSKRLARALNPPMGDSLTLQVFGRLEQRLAALAPMVDPGVGGSMARKNLRGEIEADMLRSQAAVLADYGKAVKSLKQLGARAAALQRTVEDTGALLDVGGATRELTAAVAAVAAENEVLGVKKALLVGFRHKFTLNEYDAFVLAQGDISADFFAALARAEAISDRCLLLLALDNPDLGLKVMAKNSELILRATAAVTSFCKRTLTNVFLLHNRARVDQLHLCFRYLLLRPKQLDEVMAVFVDARAAALVAEFRLQAGEAADNLAVPLSSDLRPVFYSQHDPVKYMADLLAYVHLVMVNETDTVTNVFDGRSEFAAAIDTAVPAILAALARPLKAKLETLVSAETKLAVLYQIYSHLDLYALMYARLPYAAAMAGAVRDAIRLAQDKLVLCVLTRLHAVRTSSQAHIELSLDLQPPEWLIDFYADVLPLVDGDTVFGLPEDESRRLVELLAHEPVRIFDAHLAATASAFSKTEALIFRLNFLDLVLAKIMPHALLTDEALSINHTIAALCLELKLLQLHTLLADCNLADYYNVVAMICPMDDGLDALVYQSIVENQLFTAEAIVSTNATVQAQLPTALVEVQLALMKLNSPILVNDIIRSSSAQFAQFYKLFAEIVEEYLHAPLFTWTHHDVEILLGVDES